MKNKLFPLLLCLVTLGFSIPKEAQAFCVYNATESRLMINQLYRVKGISKDISAMQTPGEFAKALNIKGVPINPNAKPEPTSACCHWENRDCSGGSQSSAVHLMLRVVEKQGTNIGIGRTGGEGYFCGKVDEQDNMGVSLTAGGWVQVEPNPGFKTNKDPAANNPKYIVKVFSTSGRHMMTYPCPGAPRKATWNDLIPDWSDVIAG